MMPQAEHFNSLDEIALRCCTLCAVHPGTLAYILCKPSEESHMRETIFKEVMRLGGRFVWYEIRRETIIGNAWSRIRLLPYAGTSECTEKVSGICCDIFAADELSPDIWSISKRIARQSVFYVTRKNRKRKEKQKV